MNIKVIPQTINKHNIIKFQAWADSHVNFPYHARAPLYFKGLSVKNSMKMMFFVIFAHIADPDEMPPFMGFVWLFIVCRSTCK